MSSKNAPELCQQPASKIELRVNDWQMGYDNCIVAFVLSLHRNAKQALCSETWPLLFPLPPFHMACAFFVSFSPLLKQHLTKEVFPIILFEIITLTTTTTCFPQQNLRLKLYLWISCTIQLC